jgi:ribose transport system ATP-binding protein
MGSGRTDLVRTIFGLENARFGSLIVHGKKAVGVGSSPQKRILQGCGYLSEDRKSEGLALPLSISDNVTMTRFSTCSRFGWLNLRRQKMQAESVISSVGIKASGAEQTVAALSGGNQQKVAIGRLVHQDADILLLDEPTRGVDIGSKSQVYETIARLAEEGKAILMISSYLPELFGMCDRLAVMCRGRLSQALPISEWTPESVMQAAIGGN